jgi:leucyl-tRNA synthetase
MSLVPERPLTLSLSNGAPLEKTVREFVDRIKRQDAAKRTSKEVEKEGVFTGDYCTNPMTKIRMPIFVANFVLMEYGTGTLMAVPTRDQRDFEFAKNMGFL